MDWIRMYCLILIWLQGVVTNSPVGFHRVFQVVVAYKHLRPLGSVVHSGARCLPLANGPLRRRLIRTQTIAPFVDSLRRFPNATLTRCTLKWLLPRPNSQPPFIAYTVPAAYPSLLEHRHYRK